MVVNMNTNIKYQSIGKAPDGSPFLTVKQARGYYEYAERPGLDSIAFILWDWNTQKFCLIKESKPPLDERFNELSLRTTAFGGSIDTDKTYKEICCIEVLEETGYKVSSNKIHSVGTTMVSTQMSQLCEGFLVDVTGLEKTYKAEYEDSKYGETIVWLTYEDLLANDDWKSIWIVVKAHYKGLL